MNITIDGESASNVIAMLALVISVIGIAIEGCAFYYSKPRIKIERHGRKEFAGFYSNPFDDTKCKWIIVLPLCIKNNSNSHACINSLCLYYQELQCAFNSRLEIKKLTFFPRPSSYTYINTTSSVKLPQTMTPMQTLSYAFVFPYADEFYNRYTSNKKPIKIKLKMEMTHGAKTFKISIGKINVRNLDTIDFSRKE